MIQIGIIGNGFVGKATHILQCPDVSVLVHDIRPELCQPEGLTLEELDASSDLIFICLPTPLRHDGACNTEIIESVLDRLRNPFVVIRSTVPITFCHKRGLFFMPEFLTEAGWEKDFRENRVWVFGLLQGDDESTRKLNDQFQERATRLLDSAHHYGRICSKTTRFLTNTEAEMVKLIRNVFLAVKVSFFNEIFDLCAAHQLDYDAIIDTVREDDRIGCSHMMVPGFHQLRGYGGTCFPKDTNNLFSVFQDSGLHSHLIEASLFRNEFIDRPQKDWLRDHGRTLMHTDATVILVAQAGSDDEAAARIVREELDGSSKLVIFYSDHEVAGLPTHDPSLRVRVGSLRSRLFFPRVDGIRVLLSNPKASDLVLAVNLGELATQNRCPLVHEGANEAWASVFQEFGH